MHRACRAAIAADVAREICRIVRFGTVMHRRSCSPARLETPDFDGQSLGTAAHFHPCVAPNSSLRRRRLVGHERHSLLRSSSHAERAPRAVVAGGPCPVQRVIDARDDSWVRIGTMQPRWLRPARSRLIASEPRHTHFCRNQRVPRLRGRLAVIRRSARRLGPLLGQRGVEPKQGVIASGRQGWLVAQRKLERTHVRVSS